MLHTLWSDTGFGYSESVSARSALLETAVSQLSLGNPQFSG